MNKIVAMMLSLIVIFSVLVTVLLGMTFIATTIIFLISTMVLVTLLVLIGSKTRAFEELTASLGKKMVLDFYAPNKKRYTFFANQIGTGKVVDVPKIGNVMVTEDSIYMDEKTSAPHGIVVGELGITSPPKLIAAAERLSDEGNENIKQVIQDNTDDDGNTQDREVPISSSYKKADDGKFDVIKYKTIRLSDFLRYFLYEVTPASIKYTIEKTLADRMEQGRSIQLKWAFVIVAVIMAGALGAVMIFAFIPSATPAATPDQIQSICAATCNTIQQASGGGLVG